MAMPELASDAKPPLSVVADHGGEHPQGKGTGSAGYSGVSPAPAQKPPSMLTGSQVEKIGFDNSDAFQKELR